MNTNRRHLSAFAASALGALLLLYAGTAAAQSTAAKGAKAFSRNLSATWKTRRTKADSIASAHGIPLRVQTADGRGRELQSFAHGIPRIFTTYNLISAQTVSSDKVWPGGGAGFSLTGAADTLGEWDEGIPLTTHQELVGRILGPDTSAVYGHSTHVAGTLIATGIDTNAKGMSYQAKLLALDWNNDVAEMADAGAAGLQVSNHSYGYVTGWDFNTLGDGKWCWFGDTTVSGSQDYRFGFYDDEAYEWDSVVAADPYYLPCKAAGNDRGEGPGSQPVVYWVFDSLGNQHRSNTVRQLDGGATGFRTLNGAANSKNVMVVGAVNGISGGYAGPGSVVMTDFSCWGPTDDGRVKPDVVADGFNVYSTYNSSNTSYATLSGTSMATPNVVGSVGLLLNEQKNLHGASRLRASILRGLIAHTADDAGTTGPDYVYGWGLLNTLHAIQLMQLDSADGTGSHIGEYNLINGDTIDIPLTSGGTAPLKVTICWTDPPGTSPPPSLNPPAPMLVNDLDLRIIRQSNDSISMPWVLNAASPASAAATGDNSVDNIEQVLISTPTAGTYTARITHKHTLAGGSQIVSVIVSGNIFHASPLLALSQSSAAFAHNPGSAAPESLKIYNRGAATLDYSAAGTQPWMIVNTSANMLAGGDSAFLRFTFDATLFSQWSSYTDTITLTTNDSTNLKKKVPLTLNTQGPKFAAPGSASFTVDSGAVTPDSVIVRNTGSMPLSVNVVHADAPPRAWLSVSPPVGSIAPGDSAAVGLDIYATSLGSGVYSASLAFSSNDSSAAPDTLVLTVHVFNGVTISSTIANLWNLVSLPVVTVNNACTDVFPGAATNGFAYDGTYISADSLRNGPGYWMKFNSAHAYALQGTALTIDSIAVVKGWNLIGSISLPVPVDSIGATAAGMVTGEVYGYAGGYKTADTIVPGKGYWIETDQDGALVLSANPASAAASRITIIHTPDLPPEPPTDGTAGGALPKMYALQEAFPDPFNPVTTIQYALPKASPVSLKVYNVLGQEVATLVNANESAGYKTAKFDGSRLPSGVYFYCLSAAAFTQIKKVVLVR